MLGNRTSLVRVGAVCLALGIVGLTPEIAQARSTSAPPPLPAPSGAVVNVSTEAQLQAAVQALASNTTIVLAAGTYKLTSTLWINGTFTNVGIRGATNNRDDVVLQGPGMTNTATTVPQFGIWSGGNVQGVTIANLTVRDFPDHPIVFNAGTQSPRVYNTHLINAGQQFVKSNPNPAGGGVNNGIVEYSVLEYTTTAKDYYTNGVDIHAGANWIVRNNLFRNIVAPAGQLAGPAVLSWDYSSNTLTEGNTFINCARGIAYGLENKTTGLDHSGGIIRNNFFYRSSTQPGDVAIAVFDSPNTQVLNNTAIASGTYPSPIEYRFTNTTGVVLTNNLVDGAIAARDGATGTLRANLTTATPAMFVNPAAGDLHLVSGATAAIDKGVATTGVTDDWDGQTRPQGAAFDIGADEYLASATTTYGISGQVTNSTGAAVSGVTVTLTGARSATATTSTTGAFSFTGLTAGGNYTVTPSRSSYTFTPASRSFTAIAANQTANFTSNRKPTVSITTPVGGASFTAPATITVSANAADADGSVTKVQFYAGSTLIGTDTTAPYSITWSTAAAGSYALTAIATDNSGATTKSSGVGITVTASAPPPPPPPNAPPTVSLTAPANGSSYAAPATMTVSASASDSDGTVSKVQFYAGSTLIGTSTAAPYSASWSVSTAGSYTLTAVATDNGGATTTSSAVAVTVTSTTPPPPPSGGLVTSLVEIGKFTVPNGDFGSPAGDGFNYGGTALAWNPVKNDLYLVGHDYDQMTAEISVPTSGTASVVHNFVDITDGHLGLIGAGNAKIGGHLFYNTHWYATGFLYYDGSGSQTVSHFVRAGDLSTTGGVTGPLRAGPMGAGMYSGYMALVPPDLQATLGGPALTGNCCLSIISRTSYGPAVFAFDPENLGNAIPLVYYTQSQQTLGTYGASGSHPVFNGTTRVKGLVVVPGTNSVLFIGRTGTGPYCYGEAAACGDPSNNSKGEHAYPYAMYVWAYDARDLAQVRAGMRQPWTVVPYATWAIPGLSGDSEFAGGATIDPATGRIFIAEPYGNGTLPMIHVFKAQ